MNDQPKAELPPLTDRLVEVIGKDAIDLAEIIFRLDQKGWLPLSDDSRAYISFYLSSHKNTFEATSRGVYQVRRTEPPIHTKSVAERHLPQKPVSRVSVYFGDVLRAGLRALQKTIGFTPKT